MKKLEDVLVCSGTRLVMDLSRMLVKGNRQLSYPSSFISPSSEVTALILINIMEQQIDYKLLSILSLSAYSVISLIEIFLLLSSQCDTPLILCW